MCFCKSVGVASVCVCVNMQVFIVFVDILVYSVQPRMLEIKPIIAVTRAKTASKRLALRIRQM